MENVTNSGCSLETQVRSGLGVTQEHCPDFNLELAGFKGLVILNGH